MTKHITTHICDRCGTSVEIEMTSLLTTGYPSEWQYLSLDQTGAKLDLCDKCNQKLVTWLSEDGATNMEAACINKREVI